MCIWTYEKYRNTEICSPLQDLHFSCFSEPKSQIQTIRVKSEPQKEIETERKREKEIERDRKR